MPLLPDVIQWHHDEITELPLGAVLLAASTDHPHQAFRLGDRAWGLQFHIECDTAMIAGWAESDAAELDELGATRTRWSRPPRELLETSRRCGSRSPPGSPRWPWAPCRTPTSRTAGTGRHPARCWAT